MQEKSWHFDPATERSTALLTNPDAAYLLLDATPKDIQKTINLYQKYSVPGYEIAHVQVIYNRKFNTKFNFYLEEQQYKKGNLAFVPKWSGMPGSTLREKTNDLLKSISQPHTDPDYPDVKLLPAWHGTRPEILDSIFKIGYSNLAFTDSGFFGKGLYSAYEAEYSYRVYSKGALILNWVACFSALPVIDGDMPLLMGKANIGNYDAHFVPVVPKDPTNKNEVNYYPWKDNQKNQYTEIVVFQTSACLPRFLVTLQPTLTKLPIKKTEEAVALYNYVAQKQNELSFHTGEVLKILDKQEIWWLAELKGKQGLIPSNYVNLTGSLPPIPPTIGTSQNFFQSATASVQAATTLEEKVSLARVLYYEGKYKKSFVLFTEVILVTQDNNQKGIIYAYTADILRLLGKYKEAEESISLANSFDKQNVSYQDLKILIQFSGAHSGSLNNFLNGKAPFFSSEIKAKNSFSS